MQICSNDITFGSFEAIVFFSAKKFDTKEIEHWNIPKYLSYQDASNDTRYDLHGSARDLGFGPNFNLDCSRPPLMCFDESPTKEAQCV